MALDQALLGAFNQAKEKGLVGDKPQEQPEQQEQQKTEDNVRQEQEKQQVQVEASEEGHEENSPQEAGSDEVAASEQPKEEQAQPEEPSQDWALEFGDDDVSDIVGDKPQEQTASPYKPLAEKLGIEGDTDDDIVSYVSSLKEKAEKAEGSFANESLAKANEIAAKGGDWESYLGLSTIDYSSVDDVEAGVIALKNKGFSQEKIDDLMDSTEGKTMIEMQGKTIKETHEQQRKQKLAEIEKQAQQTELQKQQQLEQQKKARQQLNNSLREEISKMKSEGFHGIKIPEPYYNSLEGKLTSEKGIMSLFLNDEGAPDARKIVETVAMRDLFPKVLKSAKTSAKNDGRREVMKTLQNADTTGKPAVRPKEQTESKGQSLASQMLQRHKRNWQDYKTE